MNEGMLTAQQMMVRWLGVWPWAMVLLMPAGVWGQGGADEATAVQDSEEVAGCEPLTLDALVGALEAAETKLRTAPRDALDQLDALDERLICLSEPADVGSLTRLALFQAVASLKLKDSGRAREAFVRAGGLNPRIDCRSVPAAYLRGRLLRSAQIMCNAAANARAETIQPVRLFELNSAKEIHVDGVLRTPYEDTVTMDLNPGRHLVQATFEDGVQVAWLDVDAPGLELARMQRFSLAEDLGLAPPIEAAVEVGELKIEGLEPGLTVVLDGRTRRDLPVLRNVEIGERYLQFRMADGSTRGVAVTINPGETTVYQYVASSSSSGGLRDLMSSVASLTSREWFGYGSIGLGVVSGLGSGITFAMAGGQYATAGESYQAYSALSSGKEADFASSYNSATEAQVSGNRFQSIGWVMGGVAVAAVGAGTYFLLFSGDDDPYVQFRPVIAPLLNPGQDAPGVALGLTGRF